MSPTDQPSRHLPSDLEDDAFRLARYMYENKHLGDNPIIISELRDRTNIDAEAFNSADTYLTQAKYSEGTFGGDKAQRWLTPSGVQYAKYGGKVSVEENKEPRVNQRVWSDRELMLRAIELSRKCTSEDGKIAPSVGAVIARDGIVLGEAFRGEIEPGEHAEFTLLERKLPAETLAGATLFTTLEPCTVRNRPKIACAQRVVERRIGKVFIGTLDRNPRIRGRGELQLLDAGIQIAKFDPDLLPVIEELNRDFLRQIQVRKRRTAAETMDPVPEGEVGSNGFKIGYNEAGDKVEWVEEYGETWPMVLRRNDNNILEEYNELWEKIWYVRKLIMFEKMERGDEERKPEHEPHIEKALEKMKEIEDKYGKENLGWDDFHWGFIQGKMSALAWVMGSDWESSLDT